MTLDPEKLATAIATAIQAAYDPLAARIAAIEQRPTVGCKWAGIYTDDRIYAEGDLTTRSGSLWLALRETAATPGSDAACWRLIVKANR
jgi:hypothetical protein